MENITRIIDSIPDGDDKPKWASIMLTVMSTGGGGDAICNLRLGNMKSLETGENGLHSLIIRIGPCRVTIKGCIEIERSGDLLYWLNRYINMYHNLNSRSLADWDPTVKRRLVWFSSNVGEAQQAITLHDIISKLRRYSRLDVFNEVTQIFMRPFEYLSMEVYCFATIGADWSNTRDGMRSNKMETDEIDSYFSLHSMRAASVCNQILNSSINQVDSNNLMNNSN